MVSKWFYVALVLAIFLNYSQAQSSPNKDVKTKETSVAQSTLKAISSVARKVVPKFVLKKMAQWKAERTVPIVPKRPPKSPSEEVSINSITSVLKSSDGKRSVHNSKITDIKNDLAPVSSKLQEKEKTPGVLKNENPAPVRKMRSKKSRNAKSSSVLKVEPASSAKVNKKAKATKLKKGNRKGKASGGLKKGHKKKPAAKPESSAPASNVMKKGSKKAKGKSLKKGKSKSKSPLKNGSKKRKSKKGNSSTDLEKPVKKEPEPSPQNSIPASNTMKTGRKKTPKGKTLKGKKKKISKNSDAPKDGVMKSEKKGKKTLKKKVKKSKSLKTKKTKKTKGSSDNALKEGTKKTKGKSKKSALKKGNKSKAKTLKARLKNQRAAKLKANRLKNARKLKQSKKTKQVHQNNLKADVESLKREVQGSRDPIAPAVKLFFEDMDKMFESDDFLAQTGAQKASFKPHAADDLDDETDSDSDDSDESDSDSDSDSDDSDSDSDSDDATTVKPSAAGADSSGSATTEAPDADDTGDDTGDDEADDTEDDE